MRSVELAILADPVLTERQKQALLEVYQSFRLVTEIADESADPDQTSTVAEELAEPGSADAASTTPYRTQPITPVDAHDDHRRP